MHIEQSNSTFIHFKFNFCENNAHLCIYFQLHTFLHLFFSQAGKQYHLWFNICLFQSTSVSTVQTVVYPGSDNSMCKLTLINRGHIFLGFSPLCTHIWFRRLAVWVVENLYWSHLPDFYPLFIFICFSRFAVLNVEKLHWSYSLGFTPMCTIIWILRLAAWAVASLHWSHLLDFPPLCTFMWLFRFAVRDIKKLPWSHLLGFSPLCALMPTQLPNVTATCIC